MRCKPKLTDVCPFLAALLAFAQLGFVSAQDAAPASPRGTHVQATEPSNVEYLVEGDALVAVQGDQRTPVAFEGRVVAVYRLGASLYVARGIRGVSVLDVSKPGSPRPVRDLAVNGSAIGFHLAGEQLWVETVQRNATPLDEASSPTNGEPVRSAAVGGTTVPPTVAAARELPFNATITRVSPGIVELALGRKDGVRVGDRFAIFRSKLVDGEREGGFTGEELVTVAEIVAVKEGSALAETGRSAIAQLSDQARPAKADQDNSWVYPPRVPDVGEVSVTLRPLIKAGSPLGVGILADLAATYWGSVYFAGVGLQPLGLGWTTDGVVVSTAALVEGGYDARAVAVGLGLGVGWVNGDADYMLGSFSGSDSATYANSTTTRTERQTTHAAFTLSQVARLGARDGFNLSLRNLLIYHHDEEDDDTGFIYGGTTGRLAIPLGDRSDLFIEGGGGVMGYWLAGVGVSTWVVGNGSPGSWKLSVSAGGAGIMGSKEITRTVTRPDGVSYKSEDTEDISIAGPMVALGLARRFGF